MINPRSNGTRCSDNLIDVNDVVDYGVACGQQFEQMTSWIGMGNQLRGDNAVNDISAVDRIDSRTWAWWHFRPVTLEIVEAEFGIELRLRLGGETHVGGDDLGMNSMPIRMRLGVKRS